MTLIPEVELRRATIPIFFDMMQCEFYSPRDKYAERYRDSTNIRANFHEVSLVSLFWFRLFKSLDCIKEGSRAEFTLIKFKKKVMF
jgi:hypothetical protein